jgi:hypothetical protein
MEDCSILCESAETVFGMDGRLTNLGVHRNDICEGECKAAASAKRSIKGSDITGQDENAVRIESEQSKAKVDSIAFKHNCS